MPQHTGRLTGDELAAAIHSSESLAPAEFRSSLEALGGTWRQPARLPLLLVGIGSSVVTALVVGALMWPAGVERSGVVAAPGGGIDAAALERIEHTLGELEYRVDRISRGVIEVRDELRGDPRGAE